MPRSRTVYRDGSGCQERAEEGIGVPRHTLGHGLALVPCGDDVVAASSTSTSCAAGCKAAACGGKSSLCAGGVGVRQNKTGRPRVVEPGGPNVDAVNPLRAIMR